MEYTKEQFLKTITESTDISVDEMANWRKMRGEDIKYEEIKDEGELVGWNVMGTPVLFTCGVDINDFMNEKPDLVAKLKEQFGEDLKWEQGNLTKCKPRRKLDVNRMLVEDTRLVLTEEIRRQEFIKNIQKNSKK